MLIVVIIKTSRSLNYSGWELRKTKKSLRKEKCLKKERISHKYLSKKARLKVKDINKNKISSTPIATFLDIPSFGLFLLIIVFLDPLTLNFLTVIIISTDPFTLGPFIPIIISSSHLISDFLIYITATFLFLSPGFNILYAYITIYLSFLNSGFDTLALVLLSLFIFPFFTFMSAILPLLF